MGLKLLLKRGALLTAANWPVVGIQFVAQTAFQLLLAVPIIGAAILVAVVLGADLAALLQGGLRDIFGAIVSALASEPIAFAAFIIAFAVVLIGGSVFMFLVKGGTVDVFVAAHRAAGEIEREPLLFVNLRGASTFTVPRYAGGCRRLFRRFVGLGLLLMIVYALSVGGYLALIVYGYRAAGAAGLIEWTFVAALAAMCLVVWITFVNLLYLLLQIAIAAGDIGLIEAAREVACFIRGEFREVVGICLVVLGLVVGATIASAVAWSGVGLIAFVPLVGLAVLPLQLAALLLRGLVFEYLELSALGAYVTLYCAHRARRSLPSGSRWAAGPLAAASVRSTASPL